MTVAHYNIEDIILPSENKFVLYRVQCILYTDSQLYGNEGYTVELFCETLFSERIATPCFHCMA